MKTAAISIILSAALIGGLIIISSGGNAENEASVNNVEILEGKQVVTIKAKGGYFPKVSTAKADTPTLIRVETTGTFDCSAALVLPSINYQSNLNPSGTTDIEIGPQKAGTKFQGLCSMGMYNFVVNFI